MFFLLFVAPFSFPFLVFVALFHLTVTKKRLMSCRFPPSLHFLQWLNFSSGSVWTPEIRSPFITWSLIHDSVESQISGIVTACWWVDLNWNRLPWQPSMTSANLNIYSEFMLGCSSWQTSLVVRAHGFYRDCFYSLPAHDKVPWF